MAILRRDQLTGYIKRLDSIPLKGAFAARVSPNGRYVVCSDVKSGPDYYSGTNTLTLFERDRSRNDLARLCGSRMVISVEVDEGKELAEGLVKTITGMDMGMVE